VPLGDGVGVELGHQKGVPPKRCYFAANGLYSVNTVADRYKHAAYHNKHWRWAFKFINIDDLE